MRARFVRLLFAAFAFTLSGAASAVTWYPFPLDVGNTVIAVYGYSEPFCTGTSYPSLLAAYEGIYGYSFPAGSKTNLDVAGEIASRGVGNCYGLYGGGVIEYPNPGGSWCNGECSRRSFAEMGVWIKIVSRGPTCETGHGERGYQMYLFREPSTAPRPAVEIDHEGCVWERLGEPKCVLAWAGGGGTSALATFCETWYSSTSEEATGQPTLDANWTWGVMPHSGSTFSVVSTPEYDSVDAQAPTTETLADGTTVTTEQAVKTAGGGSDFQITSGFGSGSGGSLAVTQSGGGSSTVTSTTTTTSSASGQVTTETTETVNWVKGGETVYEVDGDTGDTSETVTVPAETGGGSETTTDVQNPDGSSTSDTTSEGDTDIPHDVPAPGGGSGGEGSCVGSDCGAPAQSFGGLAGPGELLAPTMGDSLQAFYARASTAPVVAGLSSWGDGVGTAAACPTASFQLFGQPYVIDGHCTLMAQVAGTLSAVFLAFWALVSAFIFFKA